MICLDSSILIDYLNGERYVADYLSRVTEPVGVPRIVMYELYVGAVRSNDPSETIGAIDEALDWVEVLDLTDDAAKETALLRAGMIQNGEPIGALDTLIAGIARNANATLATRDRDFEKVPKLPIAVVEEDDNE